MVRTAPKDRPTSMSLEDARTIQCNGEAEGGLQSTWRYKPKYPTVPTPQRSRKIGPCPAETPGDPGLPGDIPIRCTASAPLSAAYLLPILGEPSDGLILSSSPSLDELLWRCARKFVDCRFFRVSRVRNRKAGRRLSIGLSVDSRTVHL